MYTPPPLYHPYACTIWLKVSSAFASNHADPFCKIPAYANPIPNLLSYIIALVSFFDDGHNRQPQFTAGSVAYSALKMLGFNEIKLLILLFIVLMCLEAGAPCQAQTTITFPKNLLYWALLIARLNHGQFLFTGKVFVFSNNTVTRWMKWRKLIFGWSLTYKVIQRSKAAKKFWIKAQMRCFLRKF